MHPINTSMYIHTTRHHPADPARPSKRRPPWSQVSTRFLPSKLMLAKKGPSSSHCTAVLHRCLALHCTDRFICSLPVVQYKRDIPTASCCRPYTHTLGGSCRLHFFKAASADSRRAILSSRSLTACLTSVSMASSCPR